MIKAVFFDVDDTLYSQRQPFDRAFEELLAPHYDLPCAELYVHYKEHTDEIYHHFMNGEWTLDQVAIYRLQTAMKDYGIDYPDEDCLRFQDAYFSNQQSITLSDTIKEMLTYLKDKVLIGVITNGQSEHQRRKMGVLKLQDYMPAENILVSTETPYSKPDPRLFKVMEERFSLAPEECLYIGDALLNDMQGAKSAGWETIYLNRRNTMPNAEEEKNVDLMVMTEEELLEEIKRRF